MNGEQETSASLGFEQYIRVLKRQWLTVAVFTVLGGLLAAAYLIAIPRTVTASTTVNLNVITTQPFSSMSKASSLLDDASERAIAGSQVVAARASELLKGRMTPAEIRKASTVTTSSGAAVVTVDFESTSERLAVTGADAVASAYLTFRGEQADKRIEVLVTNLNTRIDELNGAMAGINAAMAASVQESVEYQQAVSQREQIKTELDGLISERNGLKSVDTTGGIVLSTAKANEVSYAPSRTVTMLTGLAAGFVLGIIAAFVRNRFDRRLRNSKEVVRVLDEPSFATLSGADTEIPPRAAVADALRVTRERMLVDVAMGSTVLVIDATHADAPSSTAVNLAVVTAQSGRQTLLIVPEATEAYERLLQTSLGLGEGGDHGAGSHRVPNLRYFQATDGREMNQGDLLVTRQVQSEIVATPADALTFLVLSSEAHPASLLAGLRLAQAVIIVTRARATTRTELEWIRDEAESVDTPVLGSVTELRVRGQRAAQRRRGKPMEREEGEEPQTRVVPGGTPPVAAVVDGGASVSTPPADEAPAGESSAASDARADEATAVADEESLSHGESTEAAAAESVDEETDDDGDASPAPAAEGPSKATEEDAAAADDESENESDDSLDGTDDGPAVSQAAPAENGKEPRGKNRKPGKQAKPSGPDNDILDRALNTL